MDDVRKPKNPGSDNQSYPLITGRPRKKVLQKPAKQEFFRPGGEEQDPQSYDRQRTHSCERRLPSEEMDLDAQRNGDRGKGDKIERHVPAKPWAPFDGVADTVEPTEQDERGDAGAERHENREGVSQLRR